MEGRERRSSIEISPAGQIKPAGTLALKNFTIPRKKRVSGQAILEPCPEESHDHTLIQSKLRESRLDMGKEHANDWLWKDVKLVHNEAFLKEYSEKRSEMRVKGRHGREIEERFCFLVASYETTSQIYQFGLRTGSQEQYSLGKPSHGVYLFKHVDVALKHAATSVCTGNNGNLIVFKVLFGKMKKVTPSAEWNKIADPVVSFDCHMAKDAISYRDSLSQQVLGSSVFLFDYNEKQELNQRPRQCLPYAVVSFVPAVGATPLTSVSPPISPTKLPTGLFHGHSEHLKGCTVAERRGKGENATVTFKRFPSVESSGQEYQSQAPQADASSFQWSELPAAPYNHQQPQWPYYSAECFDPSTPYFDNGSWQNYMDGNTFVSTIPNQRTMSSSESNKDESMHSFDFPAEKISTIVYSSRLVKDPRLSRQETNNEKKSSEQEMSSSVTGSDKQECLTESQNHEEENVPNESWVKQSSAMEEEHRKAVSPKTSLDNPHRPDPAPQAKTEPMPLSKFFKMKFQKYAAYFRMTKEERLRYIWSQENLSTEQKKTLIDCINGYENYDQKYEQEEHLQNNVRTENAEPLNNENNERLQPTLQNISLLPETEVDQTNSVNSDTSNFTFTTEKDTTITNLDKLSTNIDKTEDSVEFKENVEQKMEFQSDFQNQNSSEVESLVKPLKQSALQMDPLEKDETSECIADSEHQLCSFQEFNPKQRPVCETNVKESTLYNTIYEFDQHNIASIEIASCVDIPVHEVTESNDCSSATAMGHEQSSQVNSENKDIESLLNSEAASHSEMSIEVQITEAQQNTTYNTLYNRLQLEQLLPSTNEVNQFSIKPYLRPKGLENPPDMHHNETVRNEENLQLIFQIKSNQTAATAERLTLSDRFSKLRGFNGKLTALVQMNRKRDVKRDPGALTSSYDLMKGNGISNAKLIQLMAHRYNEERLITNGKPLKKKQSKLNGRRKPKSGELCNIASGQLLIHVLRKTALSRKSHLLKARKKYRNTNLFSKRPFSRNFTSQSSHFLSSSETGDSIDKDLESDLNSSQTNPQNQSKSTDNEFSQEDNLTNILIENISNTNSPVSENQTCNDDGISELAQSKEQHINHSTERVDGDVLYVQSDRNEDTLEKETINISHQSSPKRKFENIESSCIDEINKEGHIENDTFQKDCAQTSSTQAKEENCAKVETSIQYSTDDKADHVQSVLSIPAAETTDDVIDRCIVEAQTAINNKTDMDTTIGVLGESPLGDSERYLTGPVVDEKVSVPSTGKSEEIKADVNIQSSELLCHAKNPDAKQKGFFPRQERSTDAERVDSAVLSVPSDRNRLHDDGIGELAQSKEQHINHSTERVDRVVLVPSDGNIKKDQLNEGAVEGSSLETQKDDRKLVALNPSDSQNQPASGDKKVSRVINSVVGTTDLTNEVIKENFAKQTVIKDNSGWHGSNITPGASETRIITRLRDYLTRFESSVKSQESINDAQKEHQVPMTWITLDSTIHKQILDTRHYNRPPLGDQKNPGSGNRGANVPVVATVAPILTVTPKVALTKHKQTEELIQPTSWTSKRRRKSKAEGPSPDSTFVEPVRKASHPNSLRNGKDTQPSNVSSTAPKTSYWLQNYDLVPHQHQTITPQGSGNQTGRQQCQVNQSSFEKANKSNETNDLPNEKLLNSYVPSDFKVTSISSILKLADHAVSLVELTSLQVECGKMLEHFTSNFEKAQSVSFSQSCITRKLILEKYLDHPPPPVELKFEAVNSFLELQMMIEAWQFVENKISFLRKRPTFRSLLWYDPSLYGELYKGAVGFQQQSSLFSSFQQCLASEDFSKLQEYYGAVSTLHQQLQDAPDTSYYMYLKTKRERLEVEAALRNPPDVKSFFLSVPVAHMMNFGDTLESLKKVQHTVTTFIETPADQLPGIFDVGKAEHLSIICRYLHEKALFLKSNKEISKVSWFGLEHLLYDASKVLVWSESSHEKSNEVLKNYKKSNPQIVYGVTEAGVTLVNKMDQRPQTMDKVPQSTPQEKMDAVKIRQAEKSTEKAQIALNSQSKDGIKETNQPAKKRVTHPTMRLNFTDGGVAPVFPTSIPTQPGNPSPYTDFPQRSNSLHWMTSGNHVWDWTPQQSSALNPEVQTLLLPKRRMNTPHLDQRAPVPDQQNHTVRQPRPRPLLVKPRPVERVNHPPLISVPRQAELSKEQTNKFTRPIIKPLPLQRFPIDTASMMPPPLPPLPFSNTLNPGTLQNNTTISYPYFIFNGQTYSTADSTVPVTPLHTGTQYHPHPV